MPCPSLLASGLGLLILGAGEVATAPTPPAQPTPAPTAVVVPVVAERAPTAAPAAGDCQPGATADAGATQTH